MILKKTKHCIFIFNYKRISKDKNDSILKTKFWTVLQGFFFPPFLRFPFVLSLQNYIIVSSIFFFWRHIAKFFIQTLKIIWNYLSCQIWLQISGQFFIQGSGLFYINVQFFIFFRWYAFIFCLIQESIITVPFLTRNMWICSKGLQ